MGDARSLPKVPPGFGETTEQDVQDVYKKEEEQKLLPASMVEIPEGFTPVYENEPVEELKSTLQPAEKVEIPEGFTPVYEDDPGERFTEALKLSFQDDDPQESRARLFGAQVLSELTGVSLKDAYNGSYDLADILCGEKTMKGFWKRIKNDIDYNWKLQNNLVPLYIRRMYGDESPELLAQIDKVEATLENPPSMEGRGILDKIIGGAASQVPMYLKSTAEGAKVGLGVAAMAALMALVGGQVPPLTAFPEEAATIPGAALFGFKTGFQTRSAHYLSEMMGALAYRDFLTMAKEKGIPIDDDYKARARTIAWGVGVINGIVEFKQFTMFREFTGLSQKAANTVVGRTMFKTLMNSKLWSLVMSTGRFVGSETEEELLQEVTQIGSEELITETERQLRGTDYDHAQMGAIAMRLVKTAIQSGFAMLGMGLPGIVMKFGPSVAQDIRALGESGRFEKLAAQAEALPVRPPQAPSAEAAPKYTFEEFKGAIDDKFRNIAPERKEKFYTLVEKLGNKLGMTRDEVAGVFIKEVRKGIDNGADLGPLALFQFSQVHYDLAKYYGEITPSVQNKWDIISELSRIDRETYKGIMEKGANRLHTATYIDRVLDRRQDLVDDIRNVEKETGAKFLDENDHLIRKILEEEMVVQEKKLKTSKVEVGELKPKYPMFSRSFAQTYIDQMPENEFEEFRQAFVKSAERAYVDRANLPSELSKFFVPEMDAKDVDKLIMSKGKKNEETGETTGAGLGGLPKGTKLSDAGFSQDITLYYVGPSIYEGRPPVWTTDPSLANRTLMQGFSRVERAIVSPDNVVTDEIGEGRYFFNIIQQSLIKNTGAVEYERVILNYNPMNLLTADQRADIVRSAARKIEPVTEQFPGIPSVLKPSEKTVVALNLNTECPMFFIGGNGCYIGGCYITSMARCGCIVPYYYRAVYGGEILQMNDASIVALNKAGGLRISGAGDVTAQQNSQLRDVIRHAYARGLQLKLITKQEAPLAMIEEMMTSEGRAGDFDFFDKDAAQNIIVQMSCDPYWVPISTDTGGEMGKMHWAETIERAQKEVVKEQGVLYHVVSGEEGRAEASKAYNEKISVWVIPKTMKPEQLFDNRITSPRERKGREFTVDPITWSLEGEWKDTQFIIAESVPVKYPEGIENTRAVNQHGRPALVYHGSPDRIVEFDKSKVTTGAKENLPEGWDRGLFFFSSDEKVSREYPGYGKDSGAGYTYAYYLDFKNPYIYESRGGGWMEANREAITAATKDYVEGHGRYDGIIIRDVYDGAGAYGQKNYADVYIAFDSEQIHQQSDKVKELQYEAMDYYKSRGRDARLMNGEVYRKFGFSSEQVVKIARKYPNVLVQLRIVVATAKEIAENALHAPWLLQTWMHAKSIGKGLYSQIEKMDISEDFLSFEKRHWIGMRDGKWAIEPRNNDGSTPPNSGTTKKFWKPYETLTNYINNEYRMKSVGGKTDAERIFETLAGQGKENPGALCCATNAAMDACGDCTAHCAATSFARGPSLQSEAWTAHHYDLFQKEEGEAKGAVTFEEDGRAIIHGFENADITTLVHETAHIFRRTLEGQMLKDAEEFCGVVNGVWEVEAEEKFADAFEEYLATQEAPTTGLKAVFAAFKQWLYDIYDGIRSTLTPAMKAVFDDMFSDELQKDDKDDVVPEEFPATRQEIASKIKNVKQRVRFLTGQVTVSELVKETDAIKERYKKAQQAYKEGLAEGKVVERVKIREKKYIKQMKAYAMRLAKYATKPVSKAVDFFYAEAIEAIGAGIDPKFRSDKKLSEIKARKDFLEKHPERTEDMPRKLMEEMDKKNLNEITVQDLEHVVAERRHLEQVGRMKLRLRETQRKRTFAEHLDIIINTINEGKPQSVTEGNLRASVPKKLIQSTQAWLLRPMRILDALDGGMAFRGPTHDFLYNRVNRFVNAAMVMEDQRKEVVQAKIKELGVLHLLFKKEKIGVWEFTHDKIIDIYMGMQNEKKRLAIIYGNFLKHSETMTGEDALDMVAQFTGKLSEKEIEFGDFLIEEYDQNYSRLRAAYIAFTNQDLGKEERYSPIKRIDPDYGDALPEQLANDMLKRSDFVRAFAEKGFTIGRKEIPPEFQKEIALGAMSTWLEQMHKQEHFIHGVNVIRDMQNMVNNESFRMAVREKIGSEYVRTLQDYANRVAAPDIYRTHTALEKLSKIGRNHVAIAALAFNLSTLLKQITGPFLYLADAGPAHFIGACAKFVVNPVSVIKFANEEPQIKDRSLDRFTEELRQQGKDAFDRFVKKVGQAGMAPLYWIDKASCAIGYQAVYDSYNWKYGDSVLAKQEALNATLRTQPASHAKDIARLYASDEWLNWFLMFTNQTNQFYNMMTYDIPKSHQKAKGGLAYQFYTVAGLTINAVVIWSIVNKRFPQDDDDWKGAMAEGFWSAIPVLGKIILDIREGWSGAMELPAAKAIQGIANLVTLVIKGEEPGKRDMSAFFEAISIVLGLPYVGTRRFVKFLDTGEPIELIGGKPKEKK